MRIKELFTVPEGEKVTEKLFGRVLVSSVCSMMLCLVCLVSTTWAWFTAGIENTGNVIEIAAVTPDVVVASGETLITPSDDGSYTLDEGIYIIGIGLQQLEKTAAGANLLEDSACPVYVTMTVSQGEDVQRRLFTFDSREDVKTHQLTVESGSVLVHFSATWLRPAGDIPDGSEPLVVGQTPTESTTAPSLADSVTPSDE